MPWCMVDQHHAMMARTFDAMIHGWSVSLDHQRAGGQYDWWRGQRMTSPMVTSTTDGVVRGWSVRLWPVPLMLSYVDSQFVGGQRWWCRGPGITLGAVDAMDLWPAGTLMASVSDAWTTSMDDQYIDGQCQWRCSPWTTSTLTASTCYFVTLTVFD